MPKNLIQDMVKIKQAKKPEVRKASPPQSVIIKSEPGFGYRLWFVAAVSMVFFLFALSYLFSEAKITVNPKIQDIILDENLSAHKDGFADSLSFDLVVISGEENKMMQGSGEKEVSKKAEGIVV